jgi:uncharacterized protein (TIGR04255 family)
LRPSAVELPGSSSTFGSDRSFLSNAPVGVATIVSGMDAKLAADTKPLQLKNPPIVEAVIGITVPRLAEGILEQLKGLAAQMLGLNYQAPTPVRQSNFQFVFKEGQPSVENRDFLLGWRFDSKDKLHSVQFKIDGFVFSRLGSYQTWEQFRGEAKKLWDLYYRVISPTELAEYGVRYINKVFIPQNEDVSQFLTVYPFIPENLPQQMLDSFMRLGLPIKAPQGRFTHQQILLPPEKPGYATVILDNDFRFSAIGLSEGKLWEQLEEVRQLKDDYFRRTLTENFLETFNA